MSMLNPFSSQYTAWRDVQQCYKTTYEKVDSKNDGKTYSAFNAKNTSKFQKFVVVAKTIAILALSLALFPVGAFVFRSLVNRMALHKEEFTDAQGDSFKGTMKVANLYQGKKTLHNGEEHEGQFDKDGKLHGKGKISYQKSITIEPNKQILLSRQGTFEKGKLQGQGRSEYSCKDDILTLFCNYNQDKANGEGRSLLNGNLFYKGSFKDDYYHGQGKKICRDGSVYVGHFETNKFHGIGKLTQKDGSKLEGRFENGSLREGKWTKADGSVLEGTWDEKGGKFTQK